MEPLQKFIEDYGQSRVREHLLTTRLIHDAGIAAAAKGYQLLVYTPTVDSDGFDVIFDDRDRLVPLQLKSIHSKGKARSWDIHRSLLRPEPEYADLFGFEASPNGTGRGGGVVLTTVAAETDTVSVTYSFTDISILTLKWRGIIGATKLQQEKLLKLKRDLQLESSGTVKLPRSAFIPCKSPAHLLAVAGLHSTIETSWRHLLLEFLRAEERQSIYTWKEEQDPSESPEKYKTALTEEVARLLG
jgi:hypothetical protein